MRPLPWLKNAFREHLKIAENCIHIMGESCLCACFVLHKSGKFWMHKMILPLWPATLVWRDRFSDIAQRQKLAKIELSRKPASKLIILCPPMILLASPCFKMTSKLSFLWWKNPPRKGTNWSSNGAVYKLTNEPTYIQHVGTSDIHCRSRYNSHCKCISTSDGKEQGGDKLE